MIKRLGARSRDWELVQETKSTDKKDGDWVLRSNDWELESRDWEL